ncbi:MAG: hypothetical protein KIS94_06985 [Chitinophagales bacterium]|nr:hypothetical protein [Chitinophagales bacterium]
MWFRLTLLAIVLLFYSSCKKAEVDEPTKPPTIDSVVAPYKHMNGVYEGKLSVGGTQSCMAFSDKPFSIEVIANNDSSATFNGEDSVIKVIGYIGNGGYTTNGIDVSKKDNSCKVFMKPVMQYAAYDSFSNISFVMYQIASGGSVYAGHEVYLSVKFFGKRYK